MKISDIDKASEIIKNHPKNTPYWEVDLAEKLARFYEECEK